MTDCAHCAELREEIAYLRSELGLLRDQQIVDYLRAEYGMTRGAARLVEALSTTAGRWVNKYRLAEMMGSDDESGRTIDVFVCSARTALGFDAIEREHGVGLRLGRPGVVAVENAKRGLAAI